MFCYRITNEVYLHITKNGTIMTSGGDKPKLPKTPETRVGDRQKRAVKIFLRITDHKQTNTKQGNSANKGNRGKK